MALTTHTVTLRTEYPGGDPLEGTWSTSVYAFPPLVKDTQGHVVITGKDPEPTDAAGVLVLTLEATGQPDLEPSDFRWQISFTSRDRNTRLGPYVFDLTADRTLDDIAESSGVPVTSAILDQAIAAAESAAADAAQTAADRAAVTAVGTSTDAMIAGAFADPASLTAAALVTRYGAAKAPNVKAPEFKCDGTDESATLQAAINQVAAGGGTGVVLVPGRVSFATPLNLTGLTAAAFVGASPAYTIGTAQQAALIYTGTGSATAMDARGRKGLGFANLNLTYTSGSFTGTLLDLSGIAGTADGTQHRLTDCLIRGVGSVNSAANLVKLDRATDVVFTDCMVLGDKAIYGKSSDASYSNAVRFVRGYVQGLTTDPVWNPGESWKFDGTVVESTPTTRLPKFIGHDAGVNCYGLVLDSLWVGDEIAAGAWVKVGAYGPRIHGGMWSMVTAGGSLVAMDGASPGGFSIEGVMCRMHAGAYVVDLAAATGTPGPVLIGVNAFTANLVAYVNGTIPNGSRVQGFGSASETIYSRATAEKRLGDVSGRYLLVAGVTGEAQDRFRLRADGYMAWGSGAAAPDVGLSKSGTSLALDPANTFRNGRGATGSRPGAAAVGNGCQWYDDTLKKPIWSDGTTWRDAAGTAV